MELKRISTAFNHIGLKTLIAEDSKLQRLIVTEYQYGKMVN